MSPIADDTTIIIRHEPETDPPEFSVQRLPDAKAAKPVAVSSPVDQAVEGRPDSNLPHELQWYLETFLDYPFPPDTDRAENVLASLRAWGTDAFETLFGSRSAGRFFDAATADDYAKLRLQISGDDPHILAWPWEALRDPEVGRVAQTCQIERRLNTVRDPRPLPEGLPTDRVNILLVTARPYEGDVRYRSISRPLVELIAKHNLPATVHVLRPPTFDALREHLRQRRGFYHILHFDGHGAYQSQAPVGNPGFTMRSAEGCLVFETEDDRDDKAAAVTAETLGELLRDNAVPAVVLNACQSAMLDGRADDPFASVATALLRSGVRSVAAMAYSLYVSGAQQFLPAFYRRLFESGDFAVAVRAGRRQMHATPGRVCARGTFPLQDWLVPVLYQQDPLDFSFAAEAVGTDVGDDAPALPEDADDSANPYGFVGRDGPILELERAMRRQTAGILITGLAGVGKTTLARGFVRWLADTHGLGNGCLWLTFQDVRTAEYVFNRMGEPLFGDQFGSAPIRDKLDALVAAFREHPFVIVWDNFEVVRGIEGTSVEATMDEADRKLLLELLTKLRGGRTKVLITSRSDEDWLGIQRRRITLPGLAGEERWEYCDRILDELGVSVDRRDADQSELMSLLDGHPLAMRTILPLLEKRSAGEVARALRTNLAALDLESLDLGAEAGRANLYAALQFVQDALDDDLQPLLIPLAMHERFVDANHVERMAKQVDEALTRKRIDVLLAALSAAGLLRDVSSGVVHEMHPALTGFLRSTCLPAVPADARDAWTRAFVDVMGSLADALAPRPLHEQRPHFHCHGANFHHARAQAERLDMDTHLAALTQSLGVYAQNTRNFKAAADLYRRLADNRETRGDEEGQAGAYHQLGRIAQEQRDFDAAEKWYRKALDINEKLGNEHDAASTHGQLGNLALARRALDEAKKQFHAALEIFERVHDEHGAAITYHQLGMIAEEQRDFDAAEKWYRKALDINEKLGNEHGAASTYHQLGSIAEEQRDFDAAGEWYRKALSVFERLGDPHHAGIVRGSMARLREASS